MPVPSNNYRSFSLNSSRFKSKWKRRKDGRDQSMGTVPGTRTSRKRRVDGTASCRDAGNSHRRQILAFCTGETHGKSCAQDFAPPVIIKQKNLIVFMAG